MDRNARYRADRLAGLLIGSAALAAAMPALAGGDLGDVGTFAKWTRIEIRLTGPDAVGTGDPNPFATSVDVTFRSPAGDTWQVPGFYDGDGNGGLDGNVWKVRFAADEIGTWTFSSASAEPSLDGWTGSFSVSAIPGDARGFYRWGRLEAVGTAADRIRYLKFRDGPYWIKAGCDDPENFLGKYTNYDTLQERIAAVDYLAERGVNSMYIMTHNVEGDLRDVWPWLGATEAEAKLNAGADARFDVDKLDEWLRLFEHMQDRGVVPYIILEDDSAWTGYDHERYYREIVARFGHLPALLFNIGEEANENYPSWVQLQYAELLESVDPYDHPRGVHNVNTPNNSYIDSPYVDFTAIQTKYPSDATLHNGLARDWINACISRARRVLMTNFDEPRPEEDRRGWWSAYTGGGVWEVHTLGPYDRPMSAWEAAWVQVGGARAFMETLPFWEMSPSNELVVSGTGFCLAKPGEAYAVYLPEGGTVSVDLTEGASYRFDWWDPANGRDGTFRDSGTVPGGVRSFRAPGTGDWALRIVREEGSGTNSPPIAHDSGTSVAVGESVEITLSYTDPDGPGPYEFTVTEDPVKGTLEGTGPTRLYTPFPDARGTDAFRWKVHDGLADSNVATVTITIETGNTPPVAIDQSVSTPEGTPLDIALSYDDPDGPGPFTFDIVEQPANGAVTQDDPGTNDVVYTPNPGFVGADTFRWRVNDGETDSNVGTVTVEVTPSSTPLPPTDLRTY